MKFLWEHSLSLALIAGFIACASLAWWSAGPDSRFGYDFWMSNAGSFGGSAILVLLARVLWERGSDPAKPPPDHQPKE